MSFAPPTCCCCCSALCLLMTRRWATRMASWRSLQARHLSSKWRCCAHSYTPSPSAGTVLQPEPWTDCKFDATFIWLLLLRGVNNGSCFTELGLQSLGGQQCTPALCEISNTRH